MGLIGLPGRRGAGHPTMRIAAILVGALLWLAPRIADAEPGEMACGQEPGNGFFWIERAFCDLPPNGPERAHGVVIWNHGISGTTQSWMAPAPPVFRLLQSRGWDVIMVKRHHLAETAPGNTLYRCLAGWVVITAVEAAVVHRAADREPIGPVDSAPVSSRGAEGICGRHLDPSASFLGNYPDLLRDF